MKNKNKHCYYLGDFSNSFENIEDFYEDVECGLHDKIDLKYIKSQGIQFLCEDSTEDSSSSCDDIRWREVLKFKKMSDVLCFLYEEYFLDFQEKMEKQIENEIHTFNEKEEYLNNVFNNFLIIRENKTTKTFSFVRKEEIKSCFEQLVEQQSDMEFEPQSYETKDSVGHTINIDPFFKEFTNKIESLIGDAYGSHLTINTEGKCSDFSIFKENGKLHKDFKKHGVLEDETPTEKGFIYEWPIKKLKQHMLWNAVWNKQSTCVFRVFLSEYNKKTNEQPFSRVYGFLIYPTEDKSSFNLKQATAEEMLKSFSKDSKTGKTIKPDAKTIYCGFDETDEICGFELI